MMKKLKRRLSLTLKRNRGIDETLSELAEQMTIDDVAALNQQQQPSLQRQRFQFHRSQPILDQMRVPSAPSLYSQHYHLSTNAEEQEEYLAPTGAIQENGECIFFKINVFTVRLSLCH